MANITIWPAKGLSVPFPNADSVSTLPTSGYTGEQTQYITDLLRSGRARTDDPLASGSLPQPNYNENAVLFSSLTAKAGEYGGQVRLLSGYATVGDGGGGEFVWDATDNTTTRDTGMCTGPSGTGRWKRRTDGRTITPAMFGAKGDCVLNVNNAPTSGTDDTAALQAFINYVAANNVQDVDMSGQFLVTGALNFTWTATGARNVKCNATFVAALTWFADETAMLYFSNCSYVYFSGRLECIGNSGNSEGSTYSSRRTGTCIEVTNSTRVKFDYIRVRKARFWGLRLMGIGNSSMCDFGTVVAYDCGQWGIAGVNTGGQHTVTFTVTEIGGTSGSASQYTKMSVPTLPAGFGDNYDSGDNFVNGLCTINGNPYLLKDIDVADKILTIYPWITISGALAEVGNTGSISYITGGAVDVQGSDGAVVNINGIDAIRCGIGLWSRTFYGPIVKRLQTQFCAVGLAIGRNFDSAHRTLVIDGLYTEANVMNLVQVAGVDVSTYIRGPYAFDLSKCFQIASPLLSPSGARTSTKLLGVNINGLEGNLWYDNRADSGENDVPTVNLRNYFGILPLYGDTKARDPSGLGIKLANPDPNFQRLFGFDTIMMSGHGTGTNGEPTGKYRFTCDSGYTVNGGTNAEFDSFTYPPLFIARLRGTNWLVSCVEMGKAPL
jgi:hypothetical protein